MAGKGKVEISGVKVEKIEDVREKLVLEPKDEDFVSAAKALEKEVDKAFQKAPLSNVANKVAHSPENAFRQVSRVEVKAFDATFLDAVEKGLDAIGKIIANPRTFIKEVQEVENVEKVRRVSVASIQHFATHSQYLRTIEDNGEVIPDKILTIHSETNTAIYENRFVMTLIKRALSFVEQRNTFVREHGETLDSDELFAHSKVNFGGVDYEVSMRVKASVPSGDAGESEKNNELLRRLSNAQQRCGDYLHSNFMNQMKGAKDITSPVHMTNMLLKHPDYHAAYELWEFIDQYESLGVSYDVKETANDFDEDYLRSLYEMLAETMLRLHSRHQSKAKAEAEVSAKRVTPTIIFGLDEIGYEDSRFLYDAFPEAEEKIDPTLLITPEERQAVVDKRAARALNESIAEARLSKAVKKDKDAAEFQGAKRRGAQKAALEEKARLKKEEEKAEEQKRLEAKRKAEAQERARKRAEENALYEEQRKKYEKPGGRR